MSNNGKNSSNLRVLVIEDNPSDAELEIAELRRGGFDISSDVAQTRDEVREFLEKSSYDVILADYNLPHFRGMEALDVMRAMRLSIPLILVTGALKSVTAVECVKQGATDYVLKDNLTRLPLSVRRALEETRLRKERQRAQDELARKVEELARSNQDLEQFAYVASHDLQEPLRMVAAYTELLAQRYHGKLDENADKYIGYAVEGAIRMQALIEDLLAFSRVGRTGEERKEIDCNAITSEAITNLTASPPPDF
jgi:CheY-like chemotaxis protein